MHQTRDVTGIIGLTGKADGNIVISLDREVALSLTEAMLGQRPESIDENVIDAVGETVNIVVGQAKSQLSQLALSIGIPTVVTGKGQSHPLHRPAGSRLVRLPIAWGQIDMCVGLAACRRVPNHRPLRPAADAHAAVALLDRSHWSPHAGR